VTGIDLVEWQLRVAAGEPLPMAQDQIPLTGHAFEARLYAEDVPKGFLPATGTLSHLRFPDTARADTGVRAGDTISPHYDPMIAKLVTHGPTRAIALGRLRQALAETQVAGTVTNLAFLGALADHEGFAAGDVDTGLIARDLDTLVTPPAPTLAGQAAAVLAALGLGAPDDWAEGFALWAPVTRRITLLQGEAETTAALETLSPGHHRLTLGETQAEARWDGTGWRIDGERAPTAVVHGQTVTVFEGYGQSYTIPDPLQRAAAAGAGADVIEAPMPGLVRAVLAAPGQPVSAGDRLAVLEAMKMEHVLTAGRDGIVAEVLVGEGTQVEAGAALIRLEATDTEDAA